MRKTGFHISLSGHLVIFNSFYTCLQGARNTSDSKQQIQLIFHQLIFLGLVFGQLAWEWLEMSIATLKAYFFPANCKWMQLSSNFFHFRTCLMRFLFFWRMYFDLSFSSSFSFFSRSSFLKPVLFCPINSLSFTLNWSSRTLFLGTSLF